MLCCAVTDQLNMNIFRSRDKTGSAIYFWLYFWHDIPELAQELVERFIYVFKALAVSFENS
jgi:hypothetical protein